MGRKDHTEAINIHQLHKNKNNKSHITFPRSVRDAITTIKDLKSTGRCFLAHPNLTFSFARVKLAMGALWPLWTLATMR